MNERKKKKTKPKTEKGATVHVDIQLWLVLSEPVIFLSMSEGED